MPYVAYCYSHTAKHCDISQDLSHLTSARERLLPPIRCLHTTNSWITFWERWSQPSMFGNQASSFVPHPTDRSATPTSKAPEIIDLFIGGQYIISWCTDHWVTFLRYLKRIFTVLVQSMFNLFFNPHFIVMRYIACCNFIWRTPYVVGSSSVSRSLILYCRACSIIISCESIHTVHPVLSLSIYAVQYLVPAQLKYMLNISDNISTVTCGQPWSYFVFAL